MPTELQIEKSRGYNLGKTILIAGFFLRLASKHERTVSLLVGLGSGTYKFNLSKREVWNHDNYSHHSCFIAHRGNPSLALQPQLGAVSQWRHWFDPSDFDHPIAASSGIATAQS